MFPVIDGRDLPRYHRAMKRAIMLIILCCVAAGCATVAMSGGAKNGYVWATGTLKATVDTPLPAVEPAVRRAFEELRFVAVDGSVEGVKASLRARMPDGTKVNVWLKAEDFEHTRVAVRVGSFGDRAISEQILKHLEAALSGD